MRLIIITTIAVLAIFYIACNKRIEDHTRDPYTCYLKCVNMYPVPLFRMFATEELDTVIFRRYISNGKFDTMISEKIYRAPDYDTIIMREGMDYELFVPSVNRHFEISGIDAVDKIDTVTAPRCSYGHCYSRTPFAIVNGDTIKTSILNEYSIGLLLFK